MTHMIHITAQITLKTLLSEKKTDMKGHISHYSLM